MVNDTNMPNDYIRFSWLFTSLEVFGFGIIVTHISTNQSNKHLREIFHIFQRFIYV